MISRTARGSMRRTLYICDVCKREMPELECTLDIRATLTGQVLVTIDCCHVCTATELERLAANGVAIPAWARDWPLRNTAAEHRRARQANDPDPDADMPCPRATCGHTLAEHGPRGCRTCACPGFELRI